MQSWWSACSRPIPCSRFSSGERGFGLSGEACRIEWLDLYVAEPNFRTFRFQCDVTDLQWDHSIWIRWVRLLDVPRTIYDPPINDVSRSVAVQNHLDRVPACPVLEVPGLEDA